MASLWPWARAFTAPGLSCLLAAWAARTLDEMSEVHVATLGTGAPACAKRRHAALREPLEEWRVRDLGPQVPSSGPGGLSRSLVRQAPTATGWPAGCLAARSAARLPHTELGYDPGGRFPP